MNGVTSQVGMMRATMEMLAAQVLNQPPVAFGNAIQQELAWTDARPPTQRAPTQYDPPVWVPFILTQHAQTTLLEDPRRKPLVLLDSLLPKQLPKPPAGLVPVGHDKDEEETSRFISTMIKAKELLNARQPPTPTKPYLPAPAALPPRAWRAFNALFSPTQLARLPQEGHPHGPF
jgi:hypothetical protein